MEDSLKGILITVTIIGLFITAILNFIVLFPQEQGVSFTDGQSQQGYLQMQNIDMGTTASLELINNQSSNAFDQWDVTTGYMGTNQIKQGQSGVSTYTGNIFSNLKLIATQLFGSNSPIVNALTVLASLASVYLIYMVIKFVRSGR